MEISTEINVENKENDTNYLNNGKNGAVFIEAEDKTVLFHTETTKIVDCETQLMTDNGTSNACKINILSNVVLHVDKVFESQESAVEEEPESSITTAINEPSHSIDNVDSDSDDDIIKRIKKSNIIDSDSESNGDGDREQVRRELFGNEPTEKNNDDELTKEVEEKSVRKRIANIIDSDSDEDLQVPPHNRSFNDEQPVFVANNRGELIPEKITNVNEQNNRLKALCDSESEEEYREDTQKEEEMTNIAKSVRRRNNKKQNTNEKPKMTAKIAAEQKREIFSERQRRVREADISLPYHRPKARTLQEFLEKRPRLASAMAISENVPASVAIKMSLRQLEVITKKLEEREKEVQEFYKSESEPEEEEASAKQEAGTNEGSVDEKEEKKSTNEEIDKTKETDPRTDPNNKEVDDTSNKNEHKIADEEINETSNIGIGEDIEKTSTEKGDDVNEETPTKGDCVQNNIDNLEEKEESPNTVKSNEENSKLSTEADFDETKESLNVIEEAAKKNETSLEDAEKDKESKDFESDKSSEYEFNLDDLEEFDLEEAKGDSKKNEKDANGLVDETIKNSTKINDTIEEGENVEKKTNQTKLLTKQELLAKLALTKPKLSGNPDEMINLQDGIKDRSVSKLMERFVKHACPINTNKVNKMEVSVVRVTSSGILKEHVSMKMDEEEPPVATEKPGAKLQKLRNVLQEQMEQKRAEQWQQKKVEKDIEEENVEDEAILDDEEEEALTESSSEEEEEEETIEDVKYVDKPRVKNDFVDDEAEETDVEEKEDEEDIAEDADDENEPESDNDDDKLNETEAAVENNKKPLKRIAKAFEDSDDSDNEFVAPKPVTLSDNIKKNSSVEIHSVSTETADDDDFPPPNQPNVFRTPLKEPTQSKDDFLLSPVTNLTGLQSFNLATQFLHESPKSPLLPVAEPSPLREPKWKDSLQKKLLFESPATNNSEVINEEKEIAQICSGSFPKCDDQTTFSNVPTQDIINMCSGQFPSFTSGSLNENEQPKDGFSFKSTVSETPEESPKENRQRTNVELIDTNTDGEIKNFDDGEENLISQLLNEEEMENFKKKLDLDSKNTPEGDRDEVKVEEIKTGGLIVDSDEENLTLKKRCNKRKLVFSDEEDSDIENEMSENEEIDLHDGDNEEEIDLPESDERDENESEKIVEYDSEENEIEVGDVRADKEALKPSDFFENEAELSESDWGSADEDEKDLDKLEQELGDEDQFDERKERANLERLHMRQMLDEDSYNIKLLQEIYLDDGELHGAGRQRQFRWRNIDNVDDKDGVRKIDDQEDGSDVEESEENWRRMRRERELFLKKQQSKQTDDSIDSLVTDSQILRLEKVTVIKSQTNTPVEKAPVRTVAQMSLPNKRGSFLSRNDQVLNRLAEFTTKINGSNVAAPKNTKNFVFHTLNDNETSSLTSEKKRKSQADGTPNAIKKLRLSNLSPATGKGNLSKSERAKKLFSNW